MKPKTHVNLSLISAKATGKTVLSEASRCRRSALTLRRHRPTHQDHENQLQGDAVGAALAVSVVLVIVSIQENLQLVEKLVKLLPEF
jgi:hypothetical protein